MEWPLTVLFEESSSRILPNLSCRYDCACRRRPGERGDKRRARVCVGGGGACRRRRAVAARPGRARQTPNPRSGTGSYRQRGVGVDPEVGALAQERHLHGSSPIPGSGERERSPKARHSKLELRGGDPSCGGTKATGGTCGDKQACSGASHKTHAKVLRLVCTYGAYPARPPRPLPPASPAPLAC